MPKCSMCDKQLSIFNQVKIGDGYICKECADMIPSIIRNKIGRYPLATIDLILQYRDNPLFEKFEETACYGRLHLDEMHGLFMISERPERITSKDKSSIFYVLDLSNVGLYCTNPRVLRDSVAVDVKFDCEFDPLGFKFSLDIEQQVFCASKKIQGGTRLDWDEPGDLSMFRNMFNQMIRNESDKFNKRYASTFMDKALLDIYTSKCVFLFDQCEKFSKSELKSRRNALIRSFHSDVSSNPVSCAQKINQAYKTLLPLAEEV